MASYKDYVAIKNLVSEYWTLKKQEEYDIFIKKLVMILGL
jgi:hypothetical protein